MRDKMETDEARAIYDMRKYTVEPVYGNIKQNLGVREFVSRGLQFVKSYFSSAYFSVTDLCCIRVSEK